jgi:hypothetical protein
MGEFLVIEAKDGLFLLIMPRHEKRCDFVR